MREISVRTGGKVLTFCDKLTIMSVADIRIQTCRLHGSQRYYKKGRSYVCLKCSADGVTRHTIRRKLKIVELCGGCCALCGYSRTPRALEFHHLDPTTKEFGIGATRSATMALERLVPELNKCVLVCANCHREIEAGLHKMEILKPYQIQLTVNDIRPKQEQRYCECGSPIVFSSQCCAVCRARTQERINWPSVDVLQEMVDRTSYLAVGRELGVSDNAVRKRMRNHAR